jgi:hypothetical protein
MKKDTCDDIIDTKTFVGKNLHVFIVDGKPNGFIGVNACRGLVKELEELRAYKIMQKNTRKK